MATTNGQVNAIEDHPDGPEIRRQVEYYFSDENLPTDEFMLQCCNGRENLPVSISRICGFKKMRGYKGKALIVAALRKSTFLSVTEDGKRVSRKVPLQGPCVIDDEFLEDDEITYDPRVEKPIALSAPLLPQKKKEYPTGMTKNMAKPTGFETTYAEAPLTPAEAEEDLSMYDPDKPFVERIEIAIQRFKQKRRMHQMYADVFTKWMLFGGVECSQRMFGTLGRDDMAQMNAEEIARATATHTVPWDRGDDKYWVVDFVGVGEAFMSSFFPAYYGYEIKKIENACKVLCSFYKYLLYHNVCPEHADSLKQALIFVDRAKTELPKLGAASIALPGPFNCAASTIFGGSKVGMYTEDQQWAMDLKEDGIDLSDLGMRSETARATFMTGVAIMRTDEEEAMPLTESIKVLRDETFSLEVLSIMLSGDRTRELYDGQNKLYASKLHFEPLGILTCRSIHLNDFHQYDLPEDKYPQGRLPKTEAGKEYTFWVEDQVLQHCFVGMKMEARILTLQGGIVILDEVKEVMCSFYKWLPNDMLMSKREVRTAVVREKAEEVVDAQGQVDGEGDGGEEFADDDFVEE